MYKDDGTGIDGPASRREFIKRTAVAGTVVWAAPAIFTVSSASAASPTPIPCPNCDSSAYGLATFGTVAGLPLNLGPIGATSDAENCLLNLNAGVITSSDVCGRTADTDKHCRASASVSGLGIVVPGVNVQAGVTRSRATWACDCSAREGIADILGLTVNGNPVNIGTAPNTTLVVINTALIDVIVTANRQSCVGGVFSVDALVVQIILTPLIGLGTNLTVVVAHSQISNGCPC